MIYDMIYFVNCN